MTKKRAVIYGRVSTKREEQEQSLDIQSIALKEMCIERGYILDDKKDVFAEKGTATSIRHRKKFLEMMYHCGLDFVRIQNGTDQFVTSKERASKYDVIFVKEASRISRHSEQGLNIVARLKEKDVDIYFNNTGKFVSEIDNLTLAILFSVAENESQATSDRIRFSKRKLAEQGVFRPSKQIYGYMKQYEGESKKTYKVVPHPQEKEVVRRIYDLYINHNYGTNKIANTLNIEGVQSNGIKKGWSSDKIRRIISNPIYYGTPINHNYSKSNVTKDYYTKKDGKPIPIEDAVEGIIDKEIFNKAQAIRADRIDEYGKHGIHKSKDNTYKGKIICLHCGGHYVKFYNSTDVISYVCSNRRQYGKAYCDGSNIRITKLNKYIESSPIHLDFSSFDFDYDLLCNDLKKAKQALQETIKVKEQEKQEIEQQAKRVLKAVIDVTNDSDDSDLLTELKNEHKQLKEQQEAIQTVIDRIDINACKGLVKRIKAKYDALCLLKDNDNNSFTFEERINIIKYIEVGKRGLKITYNTPSFAEEVREFNTMFEGTNIQINWFNPKREELNYYYYRHKGKDSILLEDHLKQVEGNYDESDVGLQKLVQELEEEHMEKMRDDMLDIQYTL